MTRPSIGGAPRAPITMGKPGPESQRRQVTVMFADISGFTAMSERLDPEVVTEIVNDCFAMIERVVLARGGQIDKYSGDAVMATFGADRALESAPKLAVLAALEVRSGLAALNRERRLPVPLDVHVGINSGLVIAGEVGGQRKRDFTVMGDTVNLAARLEDASERGQIFVGPATWSVTREHFEYRPTRRLVLKGKAEPVQAYEVVAAKEAGIRPRLGAATRRISSELVGREAELELLRRAGQRLAEGRGGFVALVAGAGMGKSRLLAELAGLAPIGSVRALVGRSEPGGASLRYHAFVDLLLDWLGLREAGSHPETLARLEREVTRAAGERAPEIVPFVATLMGLGLDARLATRLAHVDPEAMERLIVRAMHELLSALAAEQPLLVCLEDLHWADLSSIRLLESLLGLALDHPVLFVVAMRPGYTDTSDRVVAVARARLGEGATELRLEVLDAKQSALLMQNLLRVASLPAAAREAIARRAEGNPFYVEEIVRSLLDRQAIEVIDGRLEVRGEIDASSIPSTIEEVILTRVERLSPDEQKVLQVGSVLGRHFRHALLCEVTGRTAAQIERVVGELCEKQVLRAREVRTTSAVRRPLLVAELELRFEHPLIQQTIYESLLLRTRRELHRRAAAAIERLFSDRLPDFYAMLALHHTRAEQLDRAEEYLLLAGEEAARSAASSEALGFFREAYRIYSVRHGTGGEPRKRLQLEKNLALALLLTGNLREARPHFDRALGLLGERSARSTRAAYRQLLFDLTRILFRVLVRGGHMSRRPSTPELREALALLYSRARVESVADPDWFLFDSIHAIARLTTVDPATVEQSFAQWAGGSLLFAFSGISFRLSRRMARIARSLIREDRPADLFTYDLMIFMCDYFEGHWQASPGPDDALVESTMRTGQLWDVETFLGMDAYKQIDLGHFAAATARWRKICELADTYGYGFAETNKLAIPLFLAVARRRLDEAATIVERYLERPEEMLNLIGLGSQARIQLFLGRIDAAAATLAAADALVARLGRVTPFHSAWYRTAKLLLDVTELERAAGPTGSSRRAPRPLRARAARNARAALRTARALAMIRTETYRLVGSIAWLSGERRRAARWWERSLAEGRRLGARPEVARTHAEVAIRLESPGGDPGRRVDGATPAQHRAAAAALFSELDLAWDAARLAGKGYQPPGRAVA